jgi:hypothetical protein
VLKRASLAVELHSANTNGEKKVAKFKGQAAGSLLDRAGMADDVI